MLRWHVLCAGVLWLQAPWTRAAPEMTLEPSAALECLTPPAAERGAPEYPFVLYKSGQGGRVRAKVEYPGGLFGPAVTVLEHTGDDQLVLSVRRHLGGLSVPCLRPGETVTLQFDFLFEPDQRVLHWARPVDAPDPDRQRKLICLVHQRGAAQPAFPDRARRSDVQGRVSTHLVFSSPDSAPEVRLLHRESSGPLAEAVKTWAAGLRMPCHQGAPLAYSIVYVFQFDGDSFGFKDLTLRKLLPAIKGLREKGLVLDTNTMACPFELKFQYLQPHAPNNVGEVATSDPRRRPLLDWLAGVELALPDATLDAIFADRADLAVPCLKINIKPQEKTS